MYALTRMRRFLWRESGRRRRSAQGRRRERRAEEERTFPELLKLDVVHGEREENARPMAASMNEWDGGRATPKGRMKARARSPKEGRNRVDEGWWRGGSDQGLSLPSRARTLRMEYFSTPLKFSWIQSLLNLSSGVWTIF